ncbi:MAG: response regulator [Aquabacterium sp.]
MKTILIVDDELSNAEVLGLILEEEGYRVYCAANGRHGLERIPEVRPDLVVLDMMMPIMDGAEMGAALRASSDGATIKILMTSSLQESAVRARFDGYDAFIRKPFKIDEALAMIAGLLAD